MLRTEINQLLNQGSTWALVGSGISIDGGGASWRQLVENTEKHLMDHGKISSQDARIRKAIDRNDYAVAFSRLVELSSRDDVENFVRESVLQIQPGNLTKSIADWPFAGFITTNYDNCLETALQEFGASGWLPIGNDVSEISKVSGGVEKIVWHIHGAAALPEKS